MDSTNAPAESRSLSLWDCVNLIIGIVIGSSIYKTAGLIFRNVPDPWTGLGMWALCGGLSFASALCYAELATTYPRSGGEYNYLTRAFGPWAGFLFGWAQLSIIQTGSIGALSYVFAEYAVDLFRVDPSHTAWFAIGAVSLLTLLNMLGVNAGRHTQKILVTAKLLGLALLIAAGFSSHSDMAFSVSEPVKGPGWQLSMILILYAYGGWNDAGFVTAEVRQPTRNIPRALLLGLGLITAIYLLVNFGYLRALGFEGLRNSSRPAADAFAATLGDHAGRAMSLLVVISTLGGVNGLILSVSRVHATVGADHALFSWLSRWSAGTHSPIRSLLVQGLVTIGVILSVGTDGGREQIDRLFRQISLTPISWKQFGSFDSLLAISAPTFWLFFMMTATAYFVLRVKDAGRERPFKAPLFPLCPILFFVMSSFGFYSSVTYAAPMIVLVSLPVISGLLLYGVSQLIWRSTPPTPMPQTR